MFLKSSFCGLALIISFGSGLSGSVSAQTPQPEPRTPNMQLPTLHFPAGKNVVEVPFEVESGWMVIPVSVNGSRPFRYVFDSGASGAAHNNPALVDSLNLKIAGQMQVRGAGGGGAAVEVSLVENVIFTI